MRTLSELIELRSQYAAAWREIAHRVIGATHIVAYGEPRPSNVFLCNEVVQDMHSDVSADTLVKLADPEYKRPCTFTLVESYALRAQLKLLEAPQQNYVWWVYRAQDFGQNNFAAREAENKERAFGCLLLAECIERGDLDESFDGFYRDLNGHEWQFTETGGHHRVALID